VPAHPVGVAQEPQVAQLVMPALLRPDRLHARVA
jgi:hypothetical protein